MTEREARGQDGPASLWQHEILERADEITLIQKWFERNPESTAPWADGPWGDGQMVSVHLERAERAANQQLGWRAAVSGASAYRAFASLQAAEVALMRLAPPDYLVHELPNVVSECANTLPCDDPLMKKLRELAKRDGDIRERDRRVIVAAVDAAKRRSLQTQAHLRAFRNVVAIATALAGCLACLVTLIGLIAPELIPLCYRQQADDTLACPTGTLPGRLDAVLVLFAGILGATMATVLSLRKLRGSHEPYSLSIALAALKLPTGALTALLGLLLINAGFVPGFSAIGSAGQIIAWAVILGYSQEIFTSFVDRQAIPLLPNHRTRNPHRVATAPERSGRAEPQMV